MEKQKKGLETEKEGIKKRLWILGSMWVFIIAFMFERKNRRCAGNPLSGLQAEPAGVLHKKAVPLP